MRQGITTRYLAPANSRGARIKALARKRDSSRAEMSHTRPYSYDTSPAGEHTLAAKELATKLGWSGLWIGGGKPEDDGYQYVNVGSTLWDNATLRPYQTLGVEDLDWFYVAAAAKEGR